ncbi:hypothetical protein BofuT4_P098460.1 [Botrytis cinerea T4]|uniref:Uncharacterized protein n=1 Tax=Botryotinia fuckeliana (strain T4) TaxID=999810 RepID=G2YCF8_BOTF4|nr:hypothetical protein BofuT4_P098460.1 [Botrytis cinerea T4]
MALANDDPDNATSDSESVPSHNSPQLPAAGSESPPGLVEDIAAYDLGVHHTCRVGRVINQKKKCPKGCDSPVDGCPLSWKLLDEAKKRKANCEACLRGVMKIKGDWVQDSCWKKGV